MGAVRWICFLALIQGLLALNPIRAPELPDEEWESFRAQLRNPAFRLPTTTKPRHYEVTLEPYFEIAPQNKLPFTFDGEVTIYLSPTEGNIREIVMHSNDLNINSVEVTTIVNGVEQNVALDNNAPFSVEPAYSFLRIRTASVLNLNQEYIVRISFVGNIQIAMRGFYRSWYIDNTGIKRWMGTTQFQPGHARQAFPCFDEPGFKATFDITIIREQDFSPTISNMPIRLNTTTMNGKVSETFHTTPKTSTYLLAFIVSHYVPVAENTNVQRPFQIYARNNAGSTGDWSLEIGELLLEEMETYTNFSYYEMAPNMNMKQAAIPDFSAGAMENWGLLTYREANILYDPLNSNHFYKQRVANIVAHEIAHMWFGNLVTCAWWDNLWLNEGFARYYQYFLTGSVSEEMGYPDRFIVEQLHTAMFSDSVDSAHPLTDTSVNDPTSVSAHFSTITYARGASVLRMTQHLLGDSVYLQGLRNYLRERQFDVAEPHHLFNALDAVAASSGALSAYPGLTIEAYLKTWSEQAGHPRLTVNVNHQTGQMSVVQNRWERNTGFSQIPSLWLIPITWTRGGNPDFENTKPSQILTEQVTFINRGTTGLEWVIFNKQETGFYRVNYDDITWGLITRALRSSERTVIHEYNRAQIVNDVFQFARAGVMTYKKALNILSYLEFEDAYTPWLAAISGFEFLLGRYAHDQENLQILQREIIKLSAAVTRKLGYVESPGGTFMDDLQRMYVMEFLCSIGHEQCVSTAVTYFNNWKNGVYLPPNMRSWVFCTGLRQGTPADYNLLWNHYVQNDVANDKLVVLQALGCTRDAASIRSFMFNFIGDNDYFRAQDHNTALNSAIYGNEENTMVVFDWLKTNLVATNLVLGSLTTPISYIAARLRTEAQMNEFETWLNENQIQLGSAYNTGINGIQASRNNIVWANTKLSDIRDYLDVGYVDDVVELEETTAAPTVAPTTPTTTISPDAETDAANVAAISTLALLLVFINLFV